MTLLQALVLLVVMFLAAVVILRRLMAQHVTTATAHLQGLSQDYLRKHEEFKKRLDEAERHYEEQLAKVQEETRQLKDQAVKDADATRQQLLGKAHEEAERIIQQANHARDTMRQELTRSVDARAVERACEILQDALPQDLRQTTHAQWVEELIHHGLTNVERPAHREQTREARVTSAFPLTPSQRKHLLEQLQTVVGSEVTLEEAVDPRIVAGLTITVGHLVLDGSLFSKLREATRHVEDGSR